MMELLNNLENHSKVALMKIDEHLRLHDDFSCSRQIEDMKNLVESIHHIEELKAMPSMK
ncbi:MAG: hypothetical protein KBT02_13405 [Treponema sp.]|nr:hypothetical protein [Candidatus Treponema caballi]